MKECPNCKKKYPDHDAFCADCGTPLVNPAPPPSEEEPTTTIPPLLRKDLPAPASSAVPVPPPGPSTPPPPRAPVQQKSRGMLGAVIALAVCLVLAAAAAGFGLYETFQYKDKYELELGKRIVVEAERDDMQEELDKLQLYHDDTAAALEDANRQLEDARNQLADVSGQLSDGSSQLDQVRGELNTLLGMLRTGYGYSSQDYFASRGVVVLSKNSSTTITICENMPGTTVFTYRTSSAGINCQWNGSFVNGQATITVSGVSAGYYTIELTNDYNSESFAILVIVTE